MDNMYEPPGGDPQQESRPTEQFRPMTHGPDASHRPGHQQPGYQDPRYQEPRRRPPLSWTVGLVAAAALAAGGIVAGISLAGHSSPAASTSVTAGGPGTQAAALNTALNSADASRALALTSSSGAAVSGTRTTSGVTHPCAAALQKARADRKAGHPAAAKAVLKTAGARCRAVRHRLFRVALRRGIDGQLTFRGHGGTIRTVAFQRGLVMSATGGTIVVRAADGSSWTWDLVSSTVVREGGTKTSTSALAMGEPVWVGGPVISGAKDARLIVIKPPSGSSSPSSPPSASTSSGS